MKELIIKSIKEIEREYFNHSSTSFKDYEIIKDSKNPLKASESTFVADLRGNLKVNLKMENLSFKIDLESSKMLVYSSWPTPDEIRDSYDKIFTKITDGGNFKNETKLYRIPDLIIHKSESSIKQQDQLLVSEIKTDPDMTEDDFYADFFKLNLFMSELNFQNGLFIAANINHEKIIGWLTSYLNDGLFVNHNNRNIYLISIDKEVTRLSICDFSKVRLESGINQRTYIQNTYEFVNYS